MYARNWGLGDRVNEAGRGTGHHSSTKALRKRSHPAIRQTAKPARKGIRGSPCPANGSRSLRARAIRYPYRSPGRLSKIGWRQSTDFQDSRAREGLPSSATMIRRNRSHHLDRILGRLEDLDSVNLAIVVQRLARERSLLEAVFFFF